MLEFMSQLRKVNEFSEYNCGIRLDLIFFTLSSQVVTVGVVGGSDLSKITEQLGNSGIFPLPLCAYE